MKPKTNRNKQILRMRDIEGRTTYWIAAKLGISDTMVRKIYHREKENMRIAAEKAQMISNTISKGGSR